MRSYYWCIVGPSRADYLLSDASGMYALVVYMSVSTVYVLFV